MKRLRDTQATSPLMKNVRALLEAEPPLPDSRDRMLRVRAALDRPRARGNLLRVPAFAAAVAIALFGASAFAAVRIYEAIERPAASPAAAAERSARHARRAAERDVARPSAEANAEPARAGEAAEQPAVQTAQSVAAPVRAVPPRAPSREVHAVRPRAPSREAHEVERARPTRARAAGRRAPDEGARPQPSHEAELEPAQAAAVDPPAPAARTNDSELVHRAVRALRRDGDAALAARLLAEHRARSPGGPLAEEALSLQIEAALALRSPRATALAREYLARYPGGRYASIAARALQEAPR
jgi:hypothetical protein